MEIAIRPYRPDDYDALVRMTIEGFEGIAIDQMIERKLGQLNDRDWRWRKARHVDEDITANPSGVFVAEEQGRVVGYISTRVDTPAGKGRIPNLAVDAAMRGRGLGRRLIEHALDYFRKCGLQCAVIETMANNAVGQHLYTSCGFEEIGRQIHFVRKL